MQNLSNARISETGIYQGQCFSDGLITNIMLAELTISIKASKSSLRTFLKSILDSSPMDSKILNDFNSQLTNGELV